MPNTSRLPALTLLGFGLMLILAACTKPARLENGSTEEDTSISESNSAVENPEPTVDICEPSPIPGIAFPRQEPVEGPRAMMAAELIGGLIVRHGCLRVESLYGDGSILPVWPAEFSIAIENDAIVVFDGSGNPVAREGQEVYMGGGEGTAEVLVNCVRQQLPDSCPGPYWVVGDGVRPNLRFDSDLFDLELITSGERTAIFLVKHPILDDWKETPSSFAGNLRLYSPNRCPRIQSESGMTDFVPIWPPDYSMQFKDKMITVTNGSGKLVAQEGKEALLQGGMIPKIWASERYRQLYYQLPGDCHGPYWIVSE